MENEQHHYELRSRSRSRSHTPMILNHPLPEPEITEHHYDLRNRSRERSHTPGEVTSSRRSGSRSLTGSSTKMYERNMETIEESKEGSVTGSMIDNQSTKFESSIVTTRRPERRSERQRAKRQIFVNGQSESKEEDVFDQKDEQKRKSVTPCRILTSDYSSEEGEKDDPPSIAESAYEIYKQAGEWWNVFPKTDYTYSKASQCRYEIAPGILAMPNMSRRSIHVYSNDNRIPHNVQNLSQVSLRTTESGISDTDTSDLKETSSLYQTSPDNYNISDARISNSTSKTMFKKTHIEQHMSQKKIIYSNAEYSPNRWSRYPYLDSPVIFNESYESSQNAESDNELNETFEALQPMINRRWRIVQWFIYFIYIISLIFVPFKKIVQFFTSKKQTTKRQIYHDIVQSSNNDTNNTETMLQVLDRWSNSIYFLYVKVLVLDAWLLSQKRLVSIRKRLPERKLSRIFWILILPFLLILGGWYTAQYLSFLSVIKTTLHKMSQEVPYINWNNSEKNIEHEMIESDTRYRDDLLSRIETLENERIYRMEHVVNITRILEKRMQDDIKFKNEYNAKLANVDKELDINELKNTVFNELKVIKNEYKKLHELYSELKSCCNANAEAITDQAIEKHVEKILSGYFSGISKSDLAKINKKLLALQNEEDQGILNNDVDKLDEHMRKIVKDMLRIYDADKTSQVDYALESAGGQIINTRCTQRYDIQSRAFSLFGFTLYYESDNPRTVIQRNPIQPGACWAFQDFPGYLVIQLRCFIYVTGFTLEHVPRSILPDENMSSAPKKFNVWGLRNESDPEPVIFGEYEFVISDDSLQYFPVQNTEINRPFEYIELRIHSNHGQLDYTCLYRFRVHGRPA